MEVGHISAKLFLARAFLLTKRAAFFSEYLRVLILSVLKFAELGTKRRIIVICQEREEKEPVEQPLFGKQKQAVWLTAQDNVKDMKTYTITVSFLLSARSVAL